MELKLYKPTKPSIVIQTFGGNPEYYARFKDRFGNPEKGHMGIDFVATHGTPLYAVVEGLARYEADEHGGDGIVIHTDVFNYKGQPATFNVINWHLCSKDDPKFHPLIPTDGSQTKVKLGDLIGYTDNTGAPFESSGDHLHFGLVPFDLQGNAIEAHNGFNGCIDPAPYLVDTPAVNAYYQQIINSIREKVVALIKLLQK